MKNFYLLLLLLTGQLSYGQYLFTDGSNSMSGNLNIIREGYASIELKSNTGSFIDFHSNITSDFDGRIIWNINNSNQFDIYGNTNFKNEIIAPVLRISNEIRLIEGFSATDPLIGTLDNSGYGINIHKTQGMGFSLNNEHKMIIRPNGEIIWGSGAGLTTSQGAAIELRGTGTPFIDFSNDPSTDFDVRMILKNDNFLQVDGGSIGIGTSSSGSHKLAVGGSIGAREIKVEAGAWSDFVFENDYELRSLDEIEHYILKNKHLPEIPSQAEVTENGINLGEMDAKLLQKIEELTLYLIEQNKKLEKQQEEINRLKEKFK